MTPSRPSAGAPPRALVVAAVLALLGALLLAPPASAATPVPRIDLKVLVVDDGAAMVDAIADRLDAEGVPFDRIDLNAPGRAAVTAATLTVPDAAGPHGRYQAVVLPSQTPPQLSTAELTALHDYERAYGVRQVDAYTWPNATVGLNAPVYSGKVDGLTATVTAAAKAAGFGHLNGSVPLDDVDPAVTESYGYLATPVSPPAAGTTFTPFLTATVPGTSTTGTLMGVYSGGGRQELVTSFASNGSQQHFRTLAHGVVEWMTRGVHLGLYRNWFSVHIDDVLLPDSLWNETGNCTVGDDCDPVRYPETAPGATARMTAADVTHLATWQNGRMLLDLAYNGSGVAEHQAANGGQDPLWNALKGSATRFRWINHTWSHPYLGCVQDFSVTPWRCATSGGSTRWVPQATITAEIQQNTAFATTNGLPVRAGELVTGEHSGLKTAPQMATDNPYLAPALSARGITWIASDNSRETTQRKIGSALTVPRHPMNIFYNAATARQEVDEYNWIYTSRADGGSGLCETSPATTTCIKPLSLTTGFTSYIVPLEARIALQHVTGVDPRPHYAHQSNITQDRILYPVLDQVLARYRAAFAASTPLVVPSMTEAGTAIARQQGWSASKSAVSATLVGTTVTVRSTSGSAVWVPMSAPEGTKLGSATFGTAYAGSRSDWGQLPARGSAALTLPAAPGYTAPATAAAPSAASTAPARIAAPSGPSTVEIEVPDAASGAPEAAGVEQR